MVFGTFRIYGYRLCFAVRGFRKRCSRARFRDSFAACFAVRGFRACVLLFEAFGSDVPKARFREAQKIVLVDSKGNVKEFFGSGFGRFRLVSRWCLGLCASKATACVLLFEAFGSGVLFASKATACVLLFEALGSGVLRLDFATGFFGSGFGRFRFVSRWCLGLFASKATACVLLFEAFGSGVLFASKATACVLLFEALGSGVLRPDFATGFFGSGFGRFRLVSRWCLGLFASKATACVLLFEVFGPVFCCSRLSEAVFQARFREAHKIVLVDSKGNVKEFFGSGFGRFSARVQMVFRTFRI